MHSEHILDYLVYLERDCECVDRHEFWTVDGDPDIALARDFAERIRQRLGGFLDDFVSVEQRVNSVTVRLIDRCPTAA